MNFIRGHWVRVFYFLICGILVFVSFNIKDEVLSDGVSFNKFSYVGVVATLVALVVAIFEIIHGISISKSIRDEARKLLKQADDISGASFISECLSILDETNDHISGERYMLSLKCFQHFRRTYLRISGPKQVLDVVSVELNVLERELHRATHSSSKAPLTKTQRNSMQDKILGVKERLEEMNSLKRGEYVSS